MWRWGGECRDLGDNALSGPLPSELNPPNLNQLQVLYVHTAPPEGLNCGRRLCVCGCFELPRIRAHRCFL